MEDCRVEHEPKSKSNNLGFTFNHFISYQQNQVGILVDH